MRKELSTREPTATLHSPLRASLSNTPTPAAWPWVRTALEAYSKAFQTDPTSAFGGIIAFNRPVDKAAAEAVSKQFVEVLMAPDFSAEALEVFKSKVNVRLMKIALPASYGDVRNALETKRVGSGLLLQSADNHELALADLKIVTVKQPTPEELNDLLFAWKVAKFVKSNAIVFCKNGMTMGVGAGQMSRLDSARIASIKAEAAKLSLQHTWWRAMPSSRSATASTWWWTQVPPAWRNPVVPCAIKK
jgi:phosphoribosylaminoimidazolecarboxamide formyltransferase / IMP cyclohydrolase